MLNFDMKLHSRWSFVTGFFPKHVFKVYPCYSMYKYFMLSYRQITFHCIDMPHFIYSPIGGCPYLLAIMNNVAINIHLQASV